MQPKIQPFEVYNALQAMGLEEDLLSRAILQGEYERNRCTLNDPRCVPGVFAWARCVRSIRDQLLPRGWHRNDDLNRATIISPNGRIAIAVESGDEGTGKPDLIPSTKYQKGDATVRAVMANQPTLFEMFPREADVFGASELRTWLLLRRPTDTQIFAELSLPAPLVNGRIERWLDRIILKPIPFEYDFDFAESDADQPIDIQISRRVQ
jgi:hypothetical protein